MSHQALHDFGVGVFHAAEVAAEAVLVELFVRLAVPQAAGVGADLVGENDLAAEEEINGYLALEKEGEAPVWSDKAGGYGIQTVFGTKFVKGIQGDYYNVMGLPASRVYHELKNLGVLE